MTVSDASASVRFTDALVILHSVPPHLVEHLLYGLYVLVGPVAWGVLAFCLINGKQRMTFLRRPQKAIANPPRVTILIPAKDEGERIRKCVESALAQTYPNFLVITIDDRSTDRTGAVMDEMAQSNAKLRVLHIEKDALPEGWTGKCNALHRGVNTAEGEWLLFVDSDVVMEPDALASAMGVSVERNYDLLSLLLRLESGGFWERLVVPPAGAALSAIHLVALTNSDRRKSVAFANGQFMLMRRGAYEELGGHAAVRVQFCEDMEFARLFKSAGKRVRVAWGSEFAAVRMYNSFASIVRGWARIFFAAGRGSPWRIIATMLFIVLSGFSLYVAIPWGLYRNYGPVHRSDGWGWLTASAIHFAVMTLTLGLIYRWSGNPRRGALLFPLCGLMLLRVFAKALAMCAGGTVEWRGTRYVHRINESASTG